MKLCIDDLANRLEDYNQEKEMKKKLILFEKQDWIISV